MSVRLRPIRRNLAGDPVLHIEVTGWYDIYRFAHHLTHGQVEFAAVGRKIIQRCYDALGSYRFWRFMNQLWGSGDSTHPAPINELRRRAGYVRRVRDW